MNPSTSNVSVPGTDTLAPTRWVILSPLLTVSFWGCEKYGCGRSHVLLERDTLFT